MTKKRKTGLSNPLIDLCAEVFGLTSITCPRRCRLPDEYRNIGLKNVLGAWDVCSDVINSNQGKLYLPKGWELTFPDTLRMVVDSERGHRMTISDSRVYIHSPIRVQMNGDLETMTTEWVEVLHHGEVVFRSTILSSKERPMAPDVYELMKELVPPDNPYWENVPDVAMPTSEEERERANYEAYLALKPYYDEAEAFVREHYPLLNRDPNAYW